MFLKGNYLINWWLNSKLDNLKTDKDNYFVRLKFCLSLLIDKLIKIYGAFYYLYQFSNYLV